MLCDAQESWEGLDGVEVLVSGVGVEVCERGSFFLAFVTTCSCCGVSKIVCVGFC